MVIWIRTVVAYWELRRNLRELSGMMETSSTLIRMLVTWVYMFVKTHQSVQLRSIMAEMKGEEQIFFVITWIISSNICYQLLKYYYVLGIFKILLTLPICPCHYSYLWEIEKYCMYFIIQSSWPYGIIVSISQVRHRVSENLFIKHLSKHLKHLLVNLS